MPLVTFGINDKEVRHLVVEMEGRLASLEPAYKQIGEYMLRRTDERFRSETAPGGVKWQDVSPRTRRRKKHPKILTESTRLRGSINPRSSPDGVQVGTNVKYAAIHQFGGDIKIPPREQVLAFNRKGRFMAHAAAARLKKAPKWAIARMGERLITIPARPFLGIDDQDVRAIERILARHVGQKPPTA